MKTHVEEQADVRKITTTVQTIAMEVEMVHLAEMHTIPAFVRMILILAVVLAALGIRDAQGHTTVTPAQVHTVPEGAVARTERRVQEQQHVRESTTQQTAIMNPDAVGKMR
jgi:hypothetical protein